MQKIEITTPDITNTASYVFALVAAASYSGSELKRLKGINPLIDNLASSSPARELEMMLMKSSFGSSEIGIWSGEHPNSIGIFSVTPDVQVYSVDEEGNPESQVEQFDGALVDVFCHVDTHEPVGSKKELEELRSRVFSELLTSAVSIGHEFTSNVGVLERTQAPSGSSSFIGSERLGRIFKSGSSHEYSTLQALTVSSFLLEQQRFGYHFRSDFLEYKPAYSGLYILDVDK